MNPERQAEIMERLQLVDDEARPLAGTDIAGRGKHQYTRLAVVRFKSALGKDRHFVAFAESQFLFNALHDKLGTEDWIREGFDDKWIYIQELLHLPKPGETLDDYTSYISQSENDLWIALFNFIVKQGILERSARKLKAKGYGLPSTEIVKP